MKTDAIISPCGCYRNRLFRQWDAALPIFLVIGLNPSTACWKTDDPSSKRSISFAKREGCGALIMENLFSYRATKPEDMKAASDPVGEDNMAWLLNSALEAHESGGKIVAAWGVHGCFKDQDMVVLSKLQKRGHEVFCFGTTKDGFPKHPLYLRADTPLQRYEVEL